MRLTNKLEHDDALIFTRLDRLGRNAIEVATAVDRLEKMDVPIQCLALGGVGLTRPAGKMKGMLQTDLKTLLHVAACAGLKRSAGKKVS